MKKNIIFLILALFATTAIFAQPRPVRNAERELGKGNIALAKQLIDEAIADPRAQEDGRSFLIKGKIYMAIFASEDPAVKALSNDPLMVAWEAIKTGKSLPRVNPAMAIGELMVLTGHFFNSGAVNFDQGNFSRASRDLEKSFNLGKEFLSTTDTINLFYAGMSAQMANELDRAERFYNQLIEMNFNQPDLFSQIAMLHVSRGELDKALDAVKKGRVMFPDNLQLIFNEINVYLAAEDVENAQRALELAISMDPENPNLFFVLGTNFNAKLEDATTEEERLFAFGKAEEAYLSALKIDPNYFDAVFNLGVLYFNEGRRKFIEADELFRVFTRENERLGLEKEKKARELWEKSEPLFLHARDLLVPNDPNTEFVARSLKELYLRTGQTEKYQEVLKMFGEE